VKDGASQFQKFHVNFYKFHMLFSMRFITVRLGDHKFCARLVLKMLTGAHKMQRMAPALTFLQQYHRYGNEFLSNIVQVTGEETWVSFVNVETEEQSKQWMHTHSPNKQKKVKKMSARKLMATVFWDRKGVLMVEFIQQGTSNVRSVLQNTKKTA
jgi:hypothetical protein